MGEIISQAEAARRAAACAEAESYFFEIPGAVIDAFAFRNVAAFMNFSCEPNLTYRSIAAPSGDKRLQRVGFFATRDIARDEELTYRRDVNAISARSRNHIIECRCGSRLCNGYV